MHKQFGRVILLVALCSAGVSAAQSKDDNEGPHGPSVTQCDMCHTAEWKTPVRHIPDFDHSKTPFPLRFSHVGVACRQCHSSLVFREAVPKCASCHADVHRGRHSTQCDTCHSPKGWRNSLPDVASHKSRFPLKGAHAAVNCVSCHKDAPQGEFKRGLPTDCAACHLPKYERTKLPNHRASNFGTDCKRCHSADAWEGARFDHAVSTGFNLNGAHATAQCVSCHSGGRFQGVSPNCFSCHANDYAGTTEPNHARANFPRDCFACHSTAGWPGARFGHGSRAPAALTGIHQTLTCQQCHASGIYSGLNTQCVTCHLQNYRATTNPNHTLMGFPQTCDSCHTTTTFSQTTFNHSQTGFSLVGAHLNAQCIQCHTSARTSAANATKPPRDCVSCHLSNYQSAKNPNHLAAGFPQDCSICHTPAGFQFASFDHSRNRFPLTGVHTTLVCSQCHGDGKYAGRDTACVSCHLNNYLGTTNPNHTAAGFPQTCQVCHNTSGFKGATFDHSKTGFALTGAMANLSCTSCHVNGQYAGTSPLCYSCHQKQYQSVTNPNHVAAGFPTTCQTCHNTTSFSGATFNHTWFPMSMAKGGTCNSCHPNPNDFKVFTCTTCHSKSSTDSHHSGVGGYVYNSTNCYSCHRNGKAN